VAEVIDLPFLLLVFRRWLRADARDAAQIDAVLEAERAARTGLAGSNPEPGRTDSDHPDPGHFEPGHFDPGHFEPGRTVPAEVADAPWWLTDPAMQRRFRDGSR
jgi:hypothetical protein